VAFRLACSRPHISVTDIAHYIVCRKKHNLGASPLENVRIEKFVPGMSCLVL
jgi:hypothetical protein